MRKCLIIANSNYRDQYYDLPEAITSAVEVQQVLSSPVFGGYRCIPRYDLKASHIKKFLTSQLCSDENLQLCVVYILGHGHLVNDKFCFSGIDFVPNMRDKLDVQSADLLSSCELAEAIVSSVAKSTIVILDCCYATNFVDFLKRNYSQELATKSVQVLGANSSDHRTYTNGKKTNFTSQIVELILTGDACDSRVNAITLTHISSAIQRRSKQTNVLGSLFSSITAKRYPPIFCKSTSRLSEAGERIVSRMYSDDFSIMRVALEEVQQLLLTGNTHDLEIISEHLSRFSDHVMASNPDVYNSAVKIENEVREYLLNNRKDLLDALVLYTPSTFHSVSKLIERLKKDNIVYKSRLVDSVTPKEIDEFQVTSVILLVGDEGYADAAAGVDRFLKICSRAKSDEGFHSEVHYCGKNFEEFQKNGALQRLGIQVKLFDFSSTQSQKDGEKGTVPIEFLFNEIALRNEQKLKSTIQPSQRARILSPNNSKTRKPNFLIFRRSDKFVLAICDENEDVDESKLQRSYEPQIEAEIASEADLKSLGFEKQRVSPFFQDPTSQFSHIIVDASLFFQYLMFPHTKVTIPDYGYLVSKNGTVQYTISSFIRTLQHVHPAEKVLFGNIVKRKSDKVIERDLIANHPCYSRFAPTPSGSLHLGNLRTALISFLFSMPNSRQGSFEIRFDDTNIPCDEKEIGKAQIVQDLRWFGISTQKNFSQSDISRQPLYRATVELLDAAGFINWNSEGEAKLITSRAQSKMGFCYDLIKGPIITHDTERTSGRRRKLDYILNWSESGLYRYKLAGIVDDLLQSSIVVRDIRQFDSKFTIKQSVIANCIREALQVCRQNGSSLEVETFERELGKHRPKRMAALPLFCPPMYVHVSPVVNEHREILSKRKGNAGHDAARIRESGFLLRETVLVWAFVSLGSKFLKHLGYSDQNQLINDVAALGNEAFLERFRGKFDIWSLVETQKKALVKSVNLRRLDWQTLTACGPSSIVTLLDETQYSRATSKSDRQRFASAVWRDRDHFSSAKEITQFFHTLFVLGPFKEEKTAAGIWTSFYKAKVDEPHRNAKSLADFRQRIFGSRSGPQVCVLERIIERFLAS